MLKLFVRGQELIQRVMKNEEGASLAEYALLIAMVLIGVAATIVILTGSINGALQTGATCLDDGPACV